MEKSPLDTRFIASLTLWMGLSFCPPKPSVSTSANRMHSATISIGHSAAFIRGSAPMRISSM